MTRRRKRVRVLPRTLRCATCCVYKSDDNLVQNRTLQMCGGELGSRRRRRTSRRIRGRTPRRARTRSIAQPSCTIWATYHGRLRRLGGGRISPFIACCLHACLRSGWKNAGYRSRASSAAYDARYLLTPGDIAYRLCGISGRPQRIQHCWRLRMRGA